MPLSPKEFLLVKGGLLVVLAIVFFGVALVDGSWTFDGVTDPSPLISLWLVAMAVTLGGIGTKALLDAVRA